VTDAHHYRRYRFSPDVITHAVWLYFLAFTEPADGPLAERCIRLFSLASHRDRATATSMF